MRGGHNRTRGERGKVKAEDIMAGRGPGGYMEGVWIRKKRKEEKGRKVQKSREGGISYSLLSLIYQRPAPLPVPFYRLPPPS